MNSRHLPLKKQAVIRLLIKVFPYENRIMLGLENTVHYSYVLFFFHNDVELVSSIYLFDVWLKTEVPAMK